MRTPSFMSYFTSGHRGRGRRSNFLKVATVKLKIKSNHVTRTRVYIKRVSIKRHLFVFSKIVKFSFDFSDSCFSVYDYLGATMGKIVFSAQSEYP